MTHSTNKLVKYNILYIIWKIILQVLKWYINHNIKTFYWNDITILVIFFKKKVKIIKLIFFFPKNIINRKFWCYDLYIILILVKLSFKWYTICYTLLIYLWNQPLGYLKFSVWVLVKLYLKKKAFGAYETRYFRNFRGFCTYY